MKRLRISKINDDRPLSPMNCQLTLDGKGIEGVSCIRIAPIDAKNPQLAEAEITAEVDLNLEVALMQDPWRGLLRRELEELRRAMCPLGCGADIDPHTLPLKKGWHHAFGRCPAELIVDRLRAIR